MSLKIKWGVYMNCKLCGESKKDYYNYCENDGDYLRSLKNTYSMKNNVSKKCNICNTYNDSYNSYCIECGTEIYYFSK